MQLENFDDLLKEAMSDRETRCAFKENALRRRLAASLEHLREERGMSVRDLAKQMGTSASQVQRLLHADRGGSVTLTTLCRAADALGLVVNVHVRPERETDGVLVELGRVAWTSARVEIRERVTASGATGRTLAPRVRGEWKSAEVRGEPVGV